MPIRIPWFGPHLFLIILLTVLVIVAPASFATRIMTLATLFYEAGFFGRHWFLTKHGIIRWSLACVTLLGGSVIVQTAWYYMNGILGAQTDGASFITTLLFFHVVRHTFPSPESTEAIPAPPLSRYRLVWTALLLLTGAVLTGSLLYQAHLHPALDPVRTPWTLLPAGTALTYAFIALLPWLTAKRVSGSIPTLLMAMIAMLSITALIPLLYPLGFGFDGFLHRASEQVMLTTGTLSPKPFYYIGQYTFVSWLSRWFDIGIRSIDRWLVPISALLIPLGVWISARTSTLRPWMLIGLISALPMGAFIATTPQSFAYILGIASLCLALAKREQRFQSLPSIVLGLWSVAAHPLAGLPFLGTLLCLLWAQTSAPMPRWRQIFLWLGVLATIISVPFALGLNSLASSARIVWNTDSLFSLAPYQTVVRDFLVPERIHVALWADWATWGGYLSPFLLLGFAAYGYWRDRERRLAWRILIILAIGCVLMGALLRIGSDFTFLIAYERSSYAERLWIIARLLLLIPALHGLAHLIQHRTISRLATVFFLCVLAAFQAGHIYNSLPRHDAVVVGHGWSSGIADREAVHYIDQNAGGRPYTVLANQQVSAMAIEQLGFKRYVGDVFYYPVPTGGPLYQLFLNMMGNPNQETIEQAARLGQSSLVYVVLNDYWWEAERVADELKTLAGPGRSFGNNRVRVYRFDVTSERNF